MVRKNLGMAEDDAHLAIERGFIHFHEPVYSVLALVSYFVDSIYVNLQQIGDTGGRTWAAPESEAHFGARTSMAHQRKDV